MTALRHRLLGIEWAEGFGRRPLRHFFSEPLGDVTTTRRTEATCSSLRTMRTATRGHRVSKLIQGTTCSSEE
jgi:hypothetical protein